MSEPHPHDKPPSVRLRPVTREDLPALFEMQSDPESNAMAGTKPRTREVFFAIWDLHFANPLIRGRVIEMDGEEGPVGSIACFQAGEAGQSSDHVGYWIARAQWGKRIASRALPLFLAEEPRRPLHATTAAANTASQRVLERCGFRRVGTRMGEETDRFVAREIVDWVLG